MFLSALETYAVVIIIAVIAVQYAFALFCLLKLAYLDISKKEYALWNLFVLLIFFIGGIAFLIYYYKVKDTKTISKTPPQASAQPEQEGADSSDKDTEVPENTESADDETQADPVDTTENK